MKRKFQIVITREGVEYVARCAELSNAVARGTNKLDALEKIRIVISKKLGDGPDGGVAPQPVPVSPRPRGPIIAGKSKEKPDARR
jgi:hypothetical protein